MPNYKEFDLDIRNSKNGINMYGPSAVIVPATDGGGKKTVCGRTCNGSACNPNSCQTRCIKPAD
ncbi:hypothetical protein [Clostridium ihumii]|uniref:hypothetical protein n=1 Tax=Clostridium ihumii TaxID=1470356 RepID=UPI00054F4612|nr:hypothetical protein [Clostridium ihumii]